MVLGTTLPGANVGPGTATVPGLSAAGTNVVPGTAIGPQELHRLPLLQGLHESHPLHGWQGLPHGEGAKVGAKVVDGRHRGPPVQSWQPNALPSSRIADSSNSLFMRGSPKDVGPARY